ncbi:MAG: RNA polymerase sigma factor [Betaproteobacteria bacterium]|nr:RNA polymerase sigma factor [Betaproteobacteria bacterium]
MKLFYERHKSMVGRLAFASGLSDTDAADLVQEAFIRAWGAAGSFRGQSSAASWLRGIVRHLIADHIDAAVRGRSVFASPRPPAGEEDEEDYAARAESPDPGPEKLAELAQSKRCIDSCLAKLGKLHREVLSLRITGPEYKEQEVAQLLGVPLGTVKSRTSIALKQLSACVTRCSEGGSHG